MHHFAEIGIGYWTTHDTDIIRTEDLMTDRQAEILAGLKKSLSENGLRCSMVTCETFFHAVWSAGPAAESPEVRSYAAERVKNVVRIGHKLGAQFAVYWPGTLGYLMQGVIDEPQSLKWFAEVLNSACDEDILIANGNNEPTMKHCLEAKPFEPQAEIILPTTDAMLGFIQSGLLTYPEMVGVNQEYLHELMWGGAPRASLARALVAGKLWHFDVNDGYRLKHDVDLPVGLVNPSALGCESEATMVTETWRIWTLSNDTTASAYLAVSLFRGVSVILSRFASLGELANVMEILLGASNRGYGCLWCPCVFGSERLQYRCFPNGRRIQIA
jgi:xylose isomerase